MSKPSASSGPRSRSVKARSVPDDPGSTPPAAQSGLVREERIRLIAYALYVERGCEGGHELEDWLRAEMQFDAQPQCATTE